MFRFLFAFIIGFVAFQADAQSKKIFGGVVDRAPVTFNGRQPSSYPVHGIDAARFQFDMDWRAVRKSGVEFAWLKATEGGDLLDPKFKDNWRASKRAGVIRGAYHFYYFCTTPEKQAQWFIRNVPKQRGTLPPVLDLEWNPFSPTCKLRPPAAEVRDLALRFIKIVQKHYGQKLVVYTTPRFYRENGLAQLQNVEFWLRTTAKRPEEVFPGQRWHFWQYSSTGQVPGSTVDTDLNLFNGNRDQWNAWKKSRLR